MPLPNFAPRRAYHFDELLDLREITEGQITAATTVPAIEFESSFSYVAKVVINHDAITTSDLTTNYWEVSAQVATAQAGPFTEVAKSSPIAGAADNYELLISSATVYDLVPSATWVQLVATPIGAPSGLTFGAYITPGH